MGRRPASIRSLGALVELADRRRSDPRDRQASSVSSGWLEHGYVHAQ